MVKIKATHPFLIGETLIEAGLIFDIDDGDADTAFAVDWAIPFGEEIKPPKPPKPPKPKRGDSLDLEVQ
jgi:hypothetical protein